MHFISHFERNYSEVPAVVILQKRENLFREQIMLSGLQMYWLPSMQTRREKSKDPILNHAIYNLSHISIRQCIGSNSKYRNKG